MARITVEDCKIVEDKFELVNLAAERAKEIGSGAQITVERKNDKDTVVALREIANENIKPEILRESLRRRLRAYSNIEHAEEDIKQSTQELQDNEGFDYIITENEGFYVDNHDTDYTDQDFSDDIMIDDKDI